MDELKPCPFCGGGADFYIGGSGYIQCTHCLAMIPYRYGLPYADGKQQAIAAWNRRPAPENKPLTLEQLRQMDGEPVWVDGKDYGGWTIFKANANKQVANCLDNVNLSYYMRDYSKTWLAYARKPEQEAAT